MNYVMSYIRRFVATHCCARYIQFRNGWRRVRARRPLTLARQPRDGLCFHAFAYGLADGTCAHGLRRSIASAIRSRSGQRVLYGSRAIRIVELVSSCALGRGCARGRVARS